MRFLRAIALCLLLAPLFVAGQVRTDEWNGYVRDNFTFDGRPCSVVQPKKPAPGKPWLWRARFFGHRPEVDLALLDKGFHLVYMDVVEMLGNQEAVEHWNHFYDLVTTKYGLAPKAALEGMSRGGLYVYSWASANPGKVAAIYADAPVCDITTWPMTGPDGAFSPQGWKLLSTAFGFKTPDDARAYRGNPIDILEPLARAKVPLLHVVGDADDVVPVARNTAVLAQRYQALGGEIAVIHKPGIGHKHGLDDPTPIIQFLLRHTIDPLTVVPQFQDGDAVSFIGDSITHSRKWHKYVSDYYLTRFPERKIRFLNAGISGDTAAGALKRLEADILPQHPNVAVIMLGMNDVKRNLYTPGTASEATLAARRQALDDYRTNLTELAAKLSESGVRRFIFVTSSPFDDTADIATPNLPGVNEALQATGPILHDLAVKTGGSVVDFNSPMVELNRLGQHGNPSYTIVGPDRVHPGEAGMLVMAYLFLKAQDVPALVSKMTVDAQKDAASECIRCRIAKTTRSGTGLEFEVSETSLPFPAEAAAKDGLGLVRVETQLDQETLAVPGLAAGRYRLSIDGEATGELTSAELKRGINLALDPKAPQFRQAQEVLAVNEERRKLIVKLRDVAKVEENLLRPHNIPLSDDVQIRQYLTEYIEKLKGDSGGYAYYSSLVASYYKTKAVMADVRQQIEQLTTKLDSIARPRPHSYSLTKTD